eukprot:6099-Eustigmatos_ZCMA.PRE.1
MTKPCMGAAQGVWGAYGVCDGGEDKHILSHGIFVREKEVARLHAMPHGTADGHLEMLMPVAAKGKYRRGWFDSTSTA